MQPSENIPETTFLDVSLRTSLNSTRSARLRFQTIVCGQLQSAVGRELLHFAERKIATMQTADYSR